MYFGPWKYIDVFLSRKIHQCICVFYIDVFFLIIFFLAKNRIFTFFEFSKIFKLSKLQAQTDLWYDKLMLNDYFHLHLSATAIPRWIYQFSFDHWSQATSGPVSTWMGDRLGTPGAVGFLLLNLQLESFFQAKGWQRTKLTWLSTSGLNGLKVQKLSFVKKKIICIVRESNPGRPRGRRAFYHWTNDAWISNSKPTLDISRPMQ